MNRCTRATFQSTHPVRGATGSAANITATTEEISIHAPREGCDLLPLVLIWRIVKFQSTHPVRGATFDRGNVIVTGLHFNPRTP